MIDHERKAVFVHIPKTAGLSVYAAFGCENQLGHLRLRDHGPKRHDFFSFSFVRNPFERLVSVHAYLSAGGRGNEADLKARDAIGEFETFDAFARNLTECQRRLAEIRATGWGVPDPPHLNSEDRRFPHLLPQVVWTHHCGMLDLDFVGRFEHLERDWGTIAARLDLPPRLGHANSSHHKPYRDMYGWRARRAVQRAYGDDLEAFGYAF